MSGSNPVRSDSSDKHTRKRTDCGNKLDTLPFPCIHAHFSKARPSLRNRLLHELSTGKLERLWRLTSATNASLRAWMQTWGPPRLFNAVSFRLACSIRDLPARAGRSRIEQ